LMFSVWEAARVAASDIDPFLFVLVRSDAG
jgi:hypothetical protein